MSHKWLGKKQLPCVGRKNLLYGTLPLAPASLHEGYAREGAGHAYCFPCQKDRGSYKHDLLTALPPPWLTNQTWHNHSDQGQILPVIVFRPDAELTTDRVRRGDP